MSSNNNEQTDDEKLEDKVERSLTSEKKADIEAEISYRAELQRKVNVQLLDEEYKIREQKDGELREKADRNAIESDVQKETESFSEALLNLRAMLDDKDLTRVAGWLVPYFQKEVDDYKSYLIEKKIILRKDPDPEKLKQLGVYYDNVIEFMFNGIGNINKIYNCELTSIVKDKIKEKISKKESYSEYIKLINSLDVVFTKSFEICKNMSNDYTIKSENNTEVIDGSELLIRFHKAWINYGSDLQKYELNLKEQELKDELSASSQKDNNNAKEDINKAYH